MLSTVGNKICERLCTSVTPAGLRVLVHWTPAKALVRWSKVRNKRKKEGSQKGRGRSGSRSGPCRFTYFNGSSCTSGPREVHPSFLFLFLLLLPFPFFFSFCSFFSCAFFFATRRAFDGATSNNDPILGNVSHFLSLSLFFFLYLDICTDYSKWQKHLRKRQKSFLLYILFGGTLVFDVTRAHIYLKNSLTVIMKI